MQPKTVNDALTPEKIRSMFSDAEWVRMEMMTELARETVIEERVKEYTDQWARMELDAVVAKQVADRESRVGESSRMGGSGSNKNAGVQVVIPVKPKPSITTKKPVFEIADAGEDKVEEIKKLWKKKSLKGGAEWVEKNGLVSRKIFVLRVFADFLNRLVNNAGQGLGVVGLRQQRYASRVASASTNVRMYADSRRRPLCKPWGSKSASTWGC
jgi:hypothetical protein